MIKGDQQPCFSVVVPTRNRPRELARFLEALCAQTYPPERFEVVLVDDGSDRPLDTVIEPFRERLSITLLAQPNAGPANARQRGITLAKGTFLAFTDDDCQPAPDWLARLEGFCLRHPGTAVGGRTINGLTKNPFSEASQLVITYLTDHSNADPHQSKYFATSNLIFPAKEYNSAVGLDLNWSISGGEDRDLCYRWVSRGHRLLYCPDAVVHHYHYLTLRTFCRQHFNYGRGGFRHRYLAGGGRGQRLKFEKLTFYLRLPLCGFRRLPFSMAVRVTPLLGFSQVVNAAGFLWEAARTLIFRRREELARRPEFAQSSSESEEPEPAAPSRTADRL